MIPRLEVGNGGMTGDEYRTHMSLWCILAKPLQDGSAAVGLFNRGRGAMQATVEFRDVDLGNSAVMWDLWGKKISDRSRTSTPRPFPGMGS
jgi:hypothetical protein